MRKKSNQLILGFALFPQGGGGVEKQKAD